MPDEPYETTSHDDALLADGAPEDVLSWMRGHPGRVQLALEAEQARAEPRPELLAVLEYLAPLMSTIARAEA